jgi:hypothetical protein
MSDATLVIENLVLSYDALVWYVSGEGYLLEWCDATGTPYTCLIDGEE